MRQWDIAADPELFVSHNGVIDSFAGKIGFGKYNKMDMGDFRIQEDNVLLEFDINPCDSRHEFINSIEQALAGAKQVAADVSMDIVMDKASHKYSDLELQSFDKQAFIFGCDPDLNVMTGRKNRMPKAGNLRTAGGHIHIGVSGLRLLERGEVLKIQRRLGYLSDIYLGLPSVTEDPDTQRKELYGKAGAVRLKVYGIEYRTLSNYWLANRSYITSIYNRVERIVRTLDDEEEMGKLLSIAPHKDIQEIINNNDKEASRQILGEVISL